MDFPMDFWLFWMCFINVLFKVITILNFTNAVYHPPPPQKKEIYRLGPMDFKIYTLERNPRQWLDSWQSHETFAKIICVTSISGNLEFYS